jgi:hypothetical protein
MLPQEKPLYILSKGTVAPPITIPTIYTPSDTPAPKASETTFLFTDIHGNVLPNPK